VDRFEASADKADQDCPLWVALMFMV